MCVREWDRLIAKDYHMASPCSTRTTHLPWLERSLWPGRGSTLLSDAPAHPLEHNGEIHPPTPFLVSQVWDMGGHPINHNWLTLSAALPIILPWERKQKISLKKILPTCPRALCSSE